MCHTILQNGLGLFVRTHSLLCLFKPLLNVLKSRRLFYLIHTPARPRLCCVPLYKLLEGEGSFAYLDGGLIVPAREPCAYRVQAHKYIRALGQTQVFVGEQFVTAQLFIV